ncbi:MAG: hypothetical protein ACR2FQ_07730 [Pseudonocardiaceae bacterium]
MSAGLLRTYLAAVLVGALALGGCVGRELRAVSDDTRRDAGTGTVHPVVSAPDDATLIVTGTAADLATATSRALYDEAPVVVLAAAGEPGAQARAGSVAVRLGVPLLLTPSAGSPSADRSAAAVADELTRLGARFLLTFENLSTQWAQDLSGDRDVLAAPADPAELAALTRTEFGEVRTAEPLSAVTVLATGHEREVAAVATSRAAGARVLEVPGGDPRAHGEVIAALAGQPPAAVVALGDSFGTPAQLRRRLEVAATGVQLPGGGQLVVPGRLMVALYGHPGTPSLGVLGEQRLPAAIARARQVAGEYEELTELPVVPAFEIITSVASSAAGPDGDYSAEAEAEDLRPWIDAAGEAGLYVMLDLQPGRTDFLTQAKAYTELLAEPHVGLALDPEWRLKPGQQHLAQVGSVSAAEVNSVISWLAELTAKRALPQKLLILHQFRLSMVGDRDRVDTHRDEVAVLVHADGNGTPDLKLETWRALTGPLPPGMWLGWKNFYDEDSPTFSPEQTLAVEPTPLFISYQ